MSTARQELEALLTTTRTLRDRFAAHSPMSARYSILVKDVARLEALLKAA